MTSDADDFVRQARDSDKEALYRVCLLTGDSGEDASAQFDHPELLGDVFVGPYLALEQQFARVLDDGNGAEGYVLGALDTADFERRCEAHWWPPLRDRYRGLAVVPGSRDEAMLNWIRRPPAAQPFADEYPSHLHIDLLPRWQGGGWGGRLLRGLLDALRDSGSVGVHLGMARSNESALGFYQHLGFTLVQQDAQTLWLAQRLG